MLLLVEADFFVLLEGQGFSKFPDSEFRSLEINQKVRDYVESIAGLIELIQPVFPLREAAVGEVKPDACHAGPKHLHQYVFIGTGRPQCAIYF